MAGNVFIFDTTTEALTSMNGSFISPYFDGTNEKWVISKVPEISASSSGNGTSDEFEVLYDIEAESWIPISEKTLKPRGGAQIGNVKIVDSNIIGPFVDYVIKYGLSGTFGNLFFRERNVDSGFMAADYSIEYSSAWDKSIVGDFDNDLFRVNQTNNSVLLYSNLRAVILGTNFQAISWTEDPAKIGVILSPYGDIKENTLIGKYQVGDDWYILYVTANGTICKIHLSETVSERIQREANYMYQQYLF